MQRTAQAKEQAEYEAEQAEYKEHNQLTFRNKPIKWTVKGNFTTKLLPNPFSVTPEQEEVYSGTNHFIKYDGKEYEREQFLKAFFKDYKKYKYRVDFLTDNVFWLGSNQRAKLQYHILSLKYPLVKVDEQDKEDLYNLCKDHKAPTAQMWFNRMKWEKGHEKMITFGAALGVRAAQGTSKAKGVFCYCANITDETAEFTGVYNGWENWQYGITSKVDELRQELNETPKHKQKQAVQRIYDDVIIAVYYQNGQYLTLPQAENDKILSWLYKYIKDGKAEFPYKGDIPNADVAFTIDFDKDIKIVENIDLKTDMSEYNRQHNAEHNREVIGRKKVVDTFSRLTGNEWSRAEILSQGFNGNNITRFLDYGYIERTGRGQYKRVDV